VYKRPSLRSARGVLLNYLMYRQAVIICFRYLQLGCRLTSDSSRQNPAAFRRAIRIARLPGLERHAIVSGPFLTSAASCASLSRLILSRRARVSGRSSENVCSVCAAKLTSLGGRLSMPLKTRTLRSNKLALAAWACHVQWRTTRPSKRIRMPNCQVAFGT
jgi:hypothetical protein